MQALLASGGYARGHRGAAWEDGLQPGAHEPDANTVADGREKVERPRQQGDNACSCAALSSRALREIEPAALALERQGSVHPLLTLRVGIAFHQAMVDVCREFERKLAAA
jgi:hypothetical protein